jgi:hypothetical protein
MTELNNICEQLFPFFLNELSPEASEAFTHHLSSCPSCKEELEGLKQVWQTLPCEMDVVEVPEALQAQMFENILLNTRQQEEKPHLAAEAMPKIDRMLEEVKAPVRPIRRRWSFAAAAVLYLAIGAALGWGLKDYGSSKTPDSSLAAGTITEPSQVVGQYALKAFDAGMPEASGKCFVKQKGESKQLVLQVNGLKKNTGDWAYQVWLIKEGVRYNGGTFRVNDDKGDGVLTYDLGALSTFEAVGITLEPDSQGTKPRGKKVLGT